MAIISSNRYLSRQEAYDNAKYIFNFFRNIGWTSNAIAGMLGNMQRESTINPGVWQNLDYENYRGGFGLVQWTPATNLTNWASSRGLDRGSIQTQCLKIQDEYRNGGQYYPTDDFPMTFSEFARSTQTPEYLAEVFCRNYERAGVEAMQERKDNARYWYNTLANIKPAWTRRSRPEYGNPYYNNSSSGISPHYSSCITGRPTVAGLNVLCNCVGLADGAFNETYVENSDASPGEHYRLNSDASQFINLANRLGLETLPPSAYPPLGGLIVWGGSANHVAYISYVFDENKIEISQSGYDTPSWEWDIRNITRNQNGTNQWWYSTGTCLGFIVNPAIGAGPQPTLQFPEITSIQSVSSTRITVTGTANAESNSQVRLYIKWDSNNVSQSNYDTVVTVRGNFTVNITKPRRAASVAILPVRTEDGIEGSVYLATGLIVAIPCINIYVNNDMKQSIPHVYTKGRWREVLPVLRTNNQWKEIWNVKE